jgi:hypothetical protein
VADFALEFGGWRGMQLQFTQAFIITFGAQHDKKMAIFTFS